MDSKKTAVITLRTTPEIKEILQKEAEKLEWTTAKLAEKILSEWTKSRKQTGGSVSFIIEKNETININN